VKTLVVGAGIISGFTRHREMGANLEDKALLPSTREFMSVGSHDAFETEFERSMR